MAKFSVPLQTEFMPAMAGIRSTLIKEKNMNTNYEVMTPTY
ncbi:hypothetical protein SFK272_0989 [Shigella flexneri K-272]|nr:hypothetical protein SFK272_0989 [Shigella flexneri K-272]